MLPTVRETFLIAIFVVALSLNSLSSSAEADIVSFDSKFAAQAAQLQRRGWSFDAIFSELCRTAWHNVKNNPKLRLDDQVRAVFGGLWLWMSRGGNAHIQGRHDWAYHFIGGGAFEGYWDVGRSAALVKETLDAKNPHNRFDKDDLAATLLGARWMELATRSDPADAARWVELWATRQLTIERSLPTLRYGQMPRGEVADEEILSTIRRDINAALQLPPAPTP